MGSNAIVASLRKQLADRDAEIAELKRDVAHCREMMVLLEDTSARRAKEIREQERIYDILMPVIDAAIAFTRLNDSNHNADCVVFDDLIEVSAENYHALVDAVCAAYAATKAAVEQEVA